MAVKKASLLAGIDFHREKHPKHCLGEMCALTGLHVSMISLWQNAMRQIAPV